MKRSKTSSIIGPAAQRRNFERWLSEWNLFELAREAEIPQIASAASVASVKFSGIPIEPVWPQAAPVESEPPLEVGHIRLLHPDVVPHVSVPVYYAVLSDWEDDLLLACPFSPFLSPATQGELLTGRKEYPLRVLCPWSAVTVLPVLLARSWHVDCLSAKERSDAWKVFRHAATGEPLSAALRDRVGTPILHPLDSRITYQRMLAAVMAPLAHRTAVWLECEEAYPLEMAAHESGAACCHLLVERRVTAGDNPDLSPAGTAHLLHAVSGRLVVNPSETLAQSLRPRAGDLVRLVAGVPLGQGVLRKVRKPPALVVDLTGAWEALHDKGSVLAESILIVVKE